MKLLGTNITKLVELDPIESVNFTNLLERQNPNPFSLPALSYCSFVKPMQKQDLSGDSIEKKLLPFTEEDKNVLDLYEMFYTANKTLGFITGETFLPHTLIVMVNDQNNSVIIAEQTSVLTSTWQVEFKLTLENKV